MASLQFDATNVKPAGQPDPVPDGMYNVVIDESEIKPTKNGQGAYLQLRFNIMDGQFAGQKVFARLNIRNQNATAQEIAYAELSAIQHAVNCLVIQDTNELHNKPLTVKVKLKPAEGQYDASNEVKRYQAYEGGNGGQAPMQQPMQQQPQPAPVQQPVQQAHHQQQPAWDNSKAQQQAPQGGQLVENGQPTDSQPPWMQQS